MVKERYIVSSSITRKSLWGKVSSESERRISAAAFTRGESPYELPMMKQSDEWA